MKRYMVNFQDSEKLMVDMAVLLSKQKPQEFIKNAILDRSTQLLANLDNNALALIRELAEKES